MSWWPVSVNGAEKSFILDTGGAESGLSSAAVTALGLESQPILNGSFKDVTGKITTRYVRADTLIFGSMMSKDKPLMVMEGLADTADGLLAPDLLRNFDVELDFANARVNLFRHHPCDDRAVYWTGAYSVLPFNITGDGHIRVAVTLDGVETHAVLDTGAVTSLMSLDSADSLFNLTVNSPDMKKASTISGGQGGTAESYRYPFKSLTMGDVKITDPIVRLADTATFLRSNNAKLLLGLAEVRRLHVYIAYQEGKLYVSDVNAH